MKEREVLQLLAMLKGLYPAATVPAETATFWPKLLADLDAKAVLDAALKHAATSKWFPSIAELRTAVAEAVVGAPTAEEALGEVAAALANAVPARQPKFSHPAIDAAVTTIRWYFIATTSDSRLWRSQFLEAYKSIRERLVTDANQAPLLLSAGAAHAALLGDGSK